MNCHKIIWNQPYRLTCLLARMKTGHAAWHEFRTCAFAFTLNFLVIWLLFCLRAKYDSDMKPMDLPPALVFSVECGLTLACFYQLHWLAPAWVRLDEEGVAIFEGHLRRWRYDRIARIRIETLPQRVGVFRLMRIIRHDDREAVVGVPTKVDLPSVVDLLKSKGVQVTEASIERR